MKVKIGLFSFSFQPESIDWKNQSSLACDFGFWKTGRRTVFVKRFLHQPTGWNLIKETAIRPILNTPQVYDLKQDDTHYYIFFKALRGDTFFNIFRNKTQEDIFGKDGFDQHDRFQIAFSVLRTLRAINQRGYWYPDLDFKNLFLSPQKKSYRVYLIDMDSCVVLEESFEPGDVSQVYWEGLVKTYRNLGKKFLKKNSLGSNQIVPKGHLLNQSMAILFAHAIQRLGFVPQEQPLFDTLINPKCPYNLIVSSIHNQLAEGKDSWDEVEIFLSCFFKVPKNQFFKYSQNYLDPRGVNIIRYITYQYEKLKKN